MKYHEYAKKSLIVTTESPDGERDEYEFQQTEDDENLYVAKTDTHYPKEVLEYVEKRTNVDIEDSDDPLINECEMRHIRPSTGTTSGYFRHDRPLSAVVELESDGQIDEAKDILEEQARPGDRGLTIEIDTAYYHIEPDVLEVFGDEPVIVGSGDRTKEYLAGRHILIEDVGGMETVDARTVEEVAQDLAEDDYDPDEDTRSSDEKPLAVQVIEDFDPDEHVEEKQQDDAVDEDDGRGYTVHDPVPDWVEDHLPFGEDDDVDPIEEDPDGADPVLVERQKRNELDGPHYPDQDVDDQIDDDDESKYPDASGRGDDR